MNVEQELNHCAKNMFFRYNEAVIHLVPNTIAL